MFKKLIVLVLVTLGTSSCASLMGETQHQKNIDMRVQQLEARTAHLKTLERRVNNLTSISENASQLQSELRNMRGELQDLQHQVQILKDQQRQQYLDLDRRVSALESGKGMGTGNTPAGGGTSSSSGQGNSAPAQPGERKAYLNAFNLLSNGQYKKSINAFKSFLQKYPNGQYADNAHYWLGEAHYVDQDSKAAMSDFQTVVKKFPKSPKVPGSLLKIGYIYGDQGNKQEARKYLNQVISKYPNSRAASLAKQRLSAMKKEG